MALWGAPMALWGQGRLPADVDGDGRVGLSEVGAYYASVAESLGGSGADADPVVAQARFIWAHGEAYQTLADVAAPFQWVPIIDGAPGISVDSRIWRPLEWVRVPELVDDGQGTARPVVEVAAGPGGPWEILETEWGPDGALRFRAPYVPMSLLDTPRFWGRIAVDGGYRAIGWVDYENPRPESLSLSQMLQQALDESRSGAPVDAATAAAQLQAGIELGQAATLFGYYDLYQQYLIEVVRGVESTPLTPESRLALEIAADLLYWQDPTRADPVSARALSFSRFGDDCPSIEPSPGSLRYARYANLSVLSHDRCVIEAAIDDESLQKEVTDKVLEKVPETITTLTKRMGKDTARKAGKGAGNVILVAVETRSFQLAFAAASLPKVITRVQVESEGLAPEGLFLVDGPLQSSDGGCSYDSFPISKTFIDVRSDTFSFVEYLVDNKIPETDDVLSALLVNSPVPGTSLVIPFVEAATRGARKRALDRLKQALDPVDVEWRPCEWTGIEVPHRTGPGDRFPTFTLLPVSGSALQPVAQSAQGDRLPSVQRFKCVETGDGPMKMRFEMAEPGDAAENILPCLDPHVADIGWAVAPPEVEVQSEVINLRQTDAPVRLLGMVKRSWDHRLLSWRVEDRDGQAVAESVTDEPLNFQYPAATHPWEFMPPEDPDRYPLAVRAISLAGPCFEKPGLQPAEDTVMIHYQEPEFVLEAEEDCLDPNTANVITAVAEDPSLPLDVTWSVVMGDAVIEKEVGTLRATLYVDETLQAEVRVRAEAPSGYFQEKSFSVGRCLDGVQIWADFDPLFFQEARRGQSAIAWNAFTSTGGSGVGFGFAPPPGAIQPDFAGLTDPGFLGLGTGRSAFGPLFAFVDAVQYQPTGDSGWMDLRLNGMQLVGFDEDAPLGLGFDFEVAAGGAYANEIDPDAFFPLVYQPRSMEYLPSGDSYAFDVEVEVPWDPDTESFERVILAWFSDNGALEEQAFRLDETGEYGVYTQRVRFPVEVERPHIGLDMFGPVQASTLEGDGLFELDYTSSFTWKRLWVNGRSRIFFTQAEGGYAMCDFPQEALPMARRAEGCCGDFTLQGYEPMTGVVRQQAALQWIDEEPFDEENTVGQAWGLWIGNDGVDGSFCSDRPPLVEGPDPKPGPPDPDPGPDPEPEPEPGEDPTPEPLQRYFTDTPVSSDGRFAPVAADTPLSTSVTQSAFLVGETTVTYPMFLGFEGRVVLRRFNASGAILEDVEIIDEATYDALGSDLRLVAWTQWDGVNALVIERNYGSGIDIERWVYDPEKSQWTGRRLMPTSSARPAINLGEFSGDAFVDMLTLEADRAVYRHEGAADARFGSGALWFDVGEGWRVRGVVPANTPGTYLCLLDNFLDRYAIEFRDDSGAVVGARVEGDKALPLEQIMAPADFGGDGRPDLILHVPFFESFTVAPIEADGSLGTASSYPIPLLGELPGLR